MHNDMRSTAPELFKGKRLRRLVRTMGTGLCVGKQMAEARAQDHRPVRLYRF
jgi:hypothetical protein